MKLNDQTINALATAIKMRELRNQIMSSNVANAETPGYKAKKLDFEEALASAVNLHGNNLMQVGHEQHYQMGGGGISALRPEIYEAATGVVSLDGNTVDRDQELADMYENQYLYNASIDLLNKKLALKKYAITSER